MFKDEARIAGVFQGRLNNDGEDIKVNDAQGSTVVQFIYQDRHPWPAAADDEDRALAERVEPGEAVEERRLGYVGPGSRCLHRSGPRLARRQPQHGRSLP